MLVITEAEAAENARHAVVAHASTVLLLDDRSGHPVAAIGASHLQDLPVRALALDRHQGTR